MVTKWNRKTEGRYFLWTRNRRWMSFKGCFSQHNHSLISFLRRGSLEECNSGARTVCRIGGRPRRINPLSKPERKVVRSDIWKEGHPVSSRGLSEVCVFLSWSSLLRLSTWTRWLLASISGIVCASCLAEPKSPVRRLKQSTVVCCFAFVIMCRMRPWWRQKRAQTICSTCPCVTACVRMRVCMGLFGFFFFSWCRLGLSRKSFVCRW